tara:strand:- start:4 stop:234 length:231 start_codon:yes stop_codon:yes gene_type:complete
MTNPKFGDIVETNFIYSDEQREIRKFGESEVLISGQPATYHAGDVVHLPYASGETSTIEAIGLAWGAFASGVLPSG